MLSDLLTTYWLPLYRYVCNRGLDRDAAQDAVQGFFTDFLERDVIDRLDPERGSLRGLLKTSIRNYINRERQRQQTIKRGGTTRIVQIGEMDLADAKAEDPETAFDRAWAETVFERASQRLQAEFATGRRRGPITAFLDYFQSDALDYRVCAERHDMTVTGLKSFMHRTRKRYRSLLLEEIGDTLAKGSDPEAELHYFVDLLQR